MTIRSLSRKLKVAQSLAPAVRTNGTANGAGVDLRGFDSAVIIVSFGACTDGTHTPSLQHSADNSTFTNVSAAELDGEFTAVTSSSGSNSVQKVGYLGSQRYVRVVMTTSGATSGALSAANVIAGHPGSSPVQ